ncbi:hypothetical protein BEL04_22500 [Mucilaginibacter sp. PPCGB 2223]|uniref:hypothetical protein n=1 Tax=Mucilaginibacter sp. PPCGB 2223 TaxID=1886027 RepID=UPI000826A556|nr:hypothetical protein [Mucilaginibacter sp. PPCGB 2223]OCX50550.1 hypothetical protein BEL04_22500 [Mucilaginibacter sp. PPCGB 2223]
MKKILTIPAILFAAALSANAQNEVLFKMKMLPNHQYSANMKMNMDMEMNYEGTGAAMDQLKASGMKMPMLMQMETGIQSEMKTGAVNAKKEFPFSATIITLPSKMTMNGQASPEPIPNTPPETLYGKCSVNSVMPVIDSVQGKAMNDSLKNMMNKMFQNLQSAIDFPEKPMKVGDTFTQDVPFDLPVSGAGMKMSVKAVYKLLSISAGKANFDVIFTMDMNLKLGTGGQGSMSMNGGGDGKMEYDIANNYPTHYLQNMDVNYTMPIPQQTMTMKGKMKMVMDQQTMIK